MLTSEVTQREADFIESTLGRPEERVLDLACGFGRHAVGWRSGANRMTGLDFQPALHRAGPVSPRPRPA